MNLALREFLDKRERELLEEIASIRQRLAPIEAELAEVQHAKDALGIPVTASIAETTAYSLPEGISIPLPGGSLAATMTVSGTAGRHLTMKQLILEALTQHFHFGATTQELLRFFREAWGRDIERSNLSPQLSRLKDERAIGRNDETGKWFATPDARRPYRIRAGYAAGHIQWLLPHEATKDFEPVSLDSGISAAMGNPTFSPSDLVPYSGLYESHHVGHMPGPGEGEIQLTKGERFPACGNCVRYGSNVRYTINAAISD